MTSNEKSDMTLLIAVAERVAEDTPAVLATTETIIRVLPEMALPKVLVRDLWMKRRRKIGVFRSADVTNFYSVLRTMATYGQVTLNNKPGVSRSSLRDGTLTITPEFAAQLREVTEGVEDLTNIPAWDSARQQEIRLKVLKADIAAAVSDALRDFRAPTAESVSAGAAD